MIAAICSLVLLSPPKPPAWLDTSISGYVLQWDEKHPAGCFHDEKKGFYLMRTVECDGSHQGLVLTRDRKMVASYSFHVKGLPKALRNNGISRINGANFRHLSTGKGVSIGDSESKVRAKLGSPTKRAKAGNRNQFLEWHYIWRNVKKGEGTAWENTYVFKTGKLIEIRFLKDAVPGCGD